MASPQKEHGHVDIANEIIEALAKTYLSSYESQILWAIFRKTYGWHKKEDWITNSQLAEATNIKECHVSRTMKKLIIRKMVVKKGKKISFQKDHDLWQKLPKQVSSKKLPVQDENIPIQVKENTQIGIKNIPKQVYTKETKETLTKETIQKMQNKPFEAQEKPEEKPKEKSPANKIEFDFELWSWHGIDDDIMERWRALFEPDINVGSELMNIREFLKKNPGHEKIIKERFHNNYAIYIFDWLARAKGWAKENMLKESKGG